MGKIKLKTEHPRQRSAFAIKKCCIRLHAQQKQETNTTDPRRDGEVNQMSVSWEPLYNQPPLYIFLLLYRIRNITTNIPSIVLGNLTSNTEVFLKMLQKIYRTKFCAPPTPPLQHFIFYVGHQQLQDIHARLYIYICIVFSSLDIHIFPLDSDKLVK